jgi:hypothetical protein
MTDRSRIAVRVSDGESITLLQSELERFLGACQVRDTVESDMKIRLCHHSQLQQAQVDIELISAFGETTYREKVVAKVEGINLEDGCMNLFIQESRKTPDPLGKKIDKLIENKGKPLDARKAPKMIEGRARLITTKRPHEMKPASFIVKWTLAQCLHLSNRQALKLLRAARYYIEFVGKEQVWATADVDSFISDIAAAWDFIEVSERTEANRVIKALLEKVEIEEEIDHGEEKKAV